MHQSWMFSIQCSKVRNHFSGTNAISPERAATSERADVPVEPRLSEQWFLRYPKTHEALEAVRDGLVQFFPKRWEKVYGHWMENIQDWCISRQLW